LATVPIVFHLEEREQGGDGLAARPVIAPGLPWRQRGEVLDLSKLWPQAELHHAFGLHLITQWHWLNHLDSKLQFPPV
jgi:hypothetical protein